MKVRKVVLDTNVLVSAIVFGGKPRKILQEAISGSIRLILSEVLLEELKGVLTGPKFQYPEGVANTILDELRAIAEVLVPSLTLHQIISDPDDNRVLECALEGRADLIISGDPHLLDIGEFRGILIWPPAHFLRTIDK